MKITNLYMAVALATMLGFSSCVEDEGSYDYLPVNEVTVSGLEESYNVIAGVTELDIVPEIQGSLKGTDENDYSYTWYVCLNAIDNPHQHTTLSHERNLKMTLDLAPATYDLYLSIRDNETGLEWQTSADLTVQTVLTRGFYVYGEEPDGTVGMDFLSMPSGADSLIVADIFVNEQGLKGAEDLIFSGYSYSSKGQCLWAVTADGSYRITSLVAESSLFYVDETYYDGTMFYPTLDVKRPIKVLDMFPHQRSDGATASSSSRGYVTEDGIYGASVIQAETFGNPFNRYSATSTELFRPYKMPFYSANSSYVSGMMFYDMDSDRFVAANGFSWSSATSCKTLTDNPNDAFPWNQNGRTLVYGENCPNAYSYAVMKDTENTNYYIYIFRAVTSSSQTKYGSYTLDTSTVTGFGDASHYAFFVGQPYVLYAVGSQLWGINYSVSGSQPVMLKDFGSDITYMAFDWVSRGMTTDIVVCTYDESTKGTIYKYEINNDPNTIEIQPIENCEWKTDLNVKKLEFRNSSF